MLSKKMTGRFFISRIFWKKASQLLQSGKKILRENKSLKSEVGDLERQLEDNSKSVLEELQKKQRMLELEEKERLLANIPLEIVEKYNKKYKEETALEV